MKSISAETDHPISLKELKTWSSILDGIENVLLNGADPQKSSEFHVAAMREARFEADFLRDKIESHIDEAISIERLREDAAIRTEQEELMRIRRPEWDKEEFQKLVERTQGTPDQK